MFDTQVAGKLLGFQQLGLQALLDKYCSVTQNKTFQLADWRIRPLLKEMILYARQDTHSLLYIYDMMRNELIDAGNDRNNLLLSLYDQSKMLCLKVYTLHAFIHT
jgi:exosome complex exonuclease RRP6